MYATAFCGADQCSPYFVMILSGRTVRTRFTGFCHAKRLNTRKRVWFIGSPKAQNFIGGECNGSQRKNQNPHMGSFDGIISMIDSYNNKSPHPFRFFLFFSSRWSFGLEKEKKGRTPKSPARNKKYSYVYLQTNMHNCMLSLLINL